MTDVFILGGARTPMAEYAGKLKDISALELGAIAARAALERTGVKPDQIDHVVFGNVLQTSPDAVYGARHVGLRAGLPIDVPALTVNRLCGSGMEAIASAARAIAAGEADIILAGGAESMTRAPFVLPRADGPFPREAGVADTRLGWRLVSPLMQELYPPISLGETAENVAERYGVSRQRQDEFALRSHQRAASAQQAAARISLLFDATSLSSASRAKPMSVSSSMVWPMLRPRVLTSPQCSAAAGASASASGGRLAATALRLPLYRAAVSVWERSVSSSDTVGIIILVLRFEV